MFIPTCVAAAALALSCSTPPPQAEGARRLVVFRSLDSFSKTEENGEFVWTSKVIEPGFPWCELVPSWNVDMAPGQTMRIEARAVYPDRTTRYYNLGHWSPDDKLAPRESVTKQKDGDGDVLTDILSLRLPATGVQVRLVFGHDDPRLKLLTLGFLPNEERRSAREPNKRAWGKVIEAPRRSQMSYPNGNVLCSPTSVSMVLWHWANELGRPELNRDVPEVAAGVFDKNWPGTGNWPFNTAYAGAFPGMIGYVSRFNDVRELEDWIEAGFPVITSISYNLLRGNGRKPGGDGHIVVLVGFTREGDPVFNDPGRSKDVRQIYKRSDFEAAWRHAQRTVYLIHPEDAKLPEDRFGNWLPPVR
jgi:hypothetical protein